jgi:signal transduction histidine kinase
MKLSRSSILLLGAWSFFVGGYAATLLFPRGIAQIETQDFFKCVVPLFVNACLLSNAASRYRRQNAFWKLLALACTLLLASRLILAYEDLVLHDRSALPLSAELLPYLHMIPLMAALALMPHSRKVGEILRYGFLDLTLLTVLWIYLYVFAALPWKIVWPDAQLFQQWNQSAFAVQNLIVITGFGFLFAHARKEWRVIYAHILGSATLYGAGQATVWALHPRYGPAIGGLSYVGSLMWLGTAGILARKRLPVPGTAFKARRDIQWQFLSMLIVLSFPFLGAWALFASTAPLPVERFRLVATLVAMFFSSSLIFLRQHFVDRERTKLVQELSTSLDNVNRLQTQVVQSEKLASLGELAAGAAHEINNPLTAIMGYADLLIAEHVPSTRARALAEKIQEQARRTKMIVTNLLSFARQVPAEKQLLDLNTILNSAVQLRRLDLHGKNIRIELENRDSVLPAVRGDPNQLLQVFYHVIGNAVDAMDTVGGGVLLIRAFSEKGTVAIECSDTGPGMKDPEKVFDPFYTTKPVGKGTGLGLSLCYGIMQEHGGSIVGFNRPKGGCTFRLEFPAIPVSLPRVPVAPLSQRID